MDTVVKQEIFETGEVPAESRQRDVSVSVSKPALVIDLSSSDSDSYDSDDSTVGSFGKRYRASNGVGEGSKKQKFGIELPLGFLDPLPPEDEALQLPGPSLLQSQSRELVQSCKQFWKAGDYEGGHEGGSGSSQGGMDHLRVHPKFLHSNATSHKWALGAFAELLDNSLDEFCNGATYVNVDMLKNMKDGSRMLLVEDNGGGMDPDKMRLCMSLGYSVKSKLTNTIGQYGNGFKTSTMRLGADVIVFSRCHGKDGKSQTQSIGMLSYTFLRSTGKEDIVVPLLDYEKGRDWTKMIRSSPDDWNRNLEAIVQWSPYSSEADLLNQFNLMKDQGTRIIIYNLWENDEGELELDFDTDPHDIQMRGVNRDEMKIEMAKQFPSSKHFLTYRHSLRSYASILYLRRPPGFKIILRGKDVEHHNIVNDMMLPLEVTYRPQLLDGVLKDSDMMAVVKIGFVKDAKGHIDIQGFNVYHKNRLIRPFWRVWNASGSGGRGVIGVLEANFVEPAHDKQGFERTTVLARLEARLKEMQKEYWFNYCHEVGYVSHRNKKLANESAARETSPDYLPRSSSRHTQSRETPNPDSNKSHSNQKIFGRKEPERSFKAVDPKLVNGDVYRKGEKGTNTSTKYGKKSSSSETSAEDGSDHEMQIAPVERVVRGSSIMESSAQKSSSKDGNNHENDQVHTYSRQMQIAPVERVVHGTSIMASPAQKSSSKDGNNHENEQVHTSSRQMQIAPVEKVINGSSIMASPAQKSSSKDGFLSDNHEKEQVHTSSRQMDRISTRSQSKAGDATFNGDGHATSTFNACSLNLLSEENCTLKARLREMERDLQFERDRCKSLDAQVKNAEQKLEAANKEQEALIDIFSEERCRRDNEEDNLRKKLKDDSKVIQELLDRVVSLENMRCNCKTEMLTA